MLALPLRPVAAGDVLPVGPGPRPERGPTGTGGVLPASAVGPNLSERAVPESGGAGHSGMGVVPLKTWIVLLGTADRISVTADFWRNDGQKLVFMTGGSSGTEVA